KGVREMDASAPLLVINRRELLRAGAVVVGFSFGGLPAALAQATPPAAPAIDPTEVDSFLLLRRDGTAVIYSGKVDLGTGHRIAMRQMVGEELSLPVARIDLVEGDSALTPNQGPTAGSSGVMRGGVELRQAAATLREGLLALASQKLAVPADSLVLADGRITAPDDRAVEAGELAGDKPLALKMNPKAPLKDPSKYTQ